MPRNYFDTKIKKRAVKGDVGIELEYEFTSFDRALVNWNDRNDYWRNVPEGSLRGGSEFVLREPIKLGHVGRAMSALQEILDFSRIRESIRTSTHIHVNVSSLRYRDIFVFLPLYWGIENLLVATQGKNRTGNLFCLRSSDAEEIIYAVISEMTHPSNFNVFGEYKYSALNLATVSRFGSLEFRFLRMMKETNEIVPWAYALHNLVHSAGKWNTPAEVLSDLERNAVAVYRDILPPEIFQKVREQGDIQENLYSMQSLLRTYSSSFLRAMKEGPKKKYAFYEERYDQASQDQEGEDQ